MASTKALTTKANKKRNTMSKLRDAHAPREAQESSSHGDKKATARRTCKDDIFVVETRGTCVHKGDKRDAHAGGREGSSNKGRETTSASVTNKRDRDAHTQNGNNKGVALNSMCVTHQETCNTKDDEDSQEHTQATASTWNRRRLMPSYSTAKATIKYC